MKKFKGTKGKWHIDEVTRGIKNENVKGLLATAWSVYDSEKVEIRLENESWLDMRERTKNIRIEKEIERDCNNKLIASAPELLEMLQRCKFWIESQHKEAMIVKDLNQLINKILS